MRICKSCGSEQSETYTFCANCGAKLEEVVQDTILNDDVVEQQDVVLDTPSPIEEKTTEVSETNKEVSKKSNKTLIIVIAAIVVVLIGVCIALSVFK